MILKYTVEEMDPKLMKYNVLSLDREVVCKQTRSLPSSVNHNVSFDNVFLQPMLNGKDKLWAIAIIQIGSTKEYIKIAKNWKTVGEIRQRSIRFCCWC